MALPYTSLPLKWEVAHPIVASVLNSQGQRLNELPWRITIKRSDTTRTGTATLTSDADLQFDMKASSRYIFRAIVWFDTSAAADFKYQFAGPSASLVRIQHSYVVPSGTAYTVATDTALSTVASPVSGATTGGLLQAYGNVRNSTTAGLLALQWAQNTSDVSNTLVLAGSYIEWTEY